MDDDRSLVRLFSPWFIRRTLVWGEAVVHTPSFGRSGFGTGIDPWGWLQEWMVDFVWKARGLRRRGGRWAEEAEPQKLNL